MASTFLENVQKIKELFSSCTTPEETYEKIIEIGKHAPVLDAQYKTEDNRIEGCQSTTYIRSTFKDGRVFFEATSDAFISAGLAALLLQAYSDQSPDVIIKMSPDFLTEIGIASALSPNRANGLREMVLRIKKDALMYLLKK